MKKKVVVIEDDASIRDILQIILERAGYSVDDYQDGMAVMKGQVRCPDIFVIDRQLSGVDGLEICRQLRSQPATAKVPIIVLSATPGIENLGKKCRRRRIC